MSQWNPSPILGSANWAGNPQVATKNQLLSTSAGGVTISLLTSTSKGLADYTTTASNVLQTEINSIVAGGTTSLWANYRAINNVDISGYNLSNVNILQGRFMSTMDLQVSSINGAEVQLTSSNVTIQNVTMKDGTVTSSNSSSSNTTLNRAVGAVNAVAGAVTNINTAVGGFLSNNFGVLQQAYYGVATAGQIVDLATGTVQLATGIQAMVDSRQQNFIAGPGGPPGQTSYVYETFNHTTQFQFSTIGSNITTVYRTTDQVNPNQSFGREVFISTIIPAGSKVVRSVSDPFNMPIASTQLLSTTNFIQSFGQWSAVAGPDYNLFVSTLAANAISSFTLSTGAALISSLNGQPASAFLNTDTFNGISANKISSATITASTLYADQISTGLILGAGYNGSLIFGDITNTNYIQTFANTGAIIRYTVPTGTLQIDSGNLILGYNSNISFNGSPYAPVNPNLTLTTLNVPSISTTNIQGSNAFFLNANISSLNASSIYVQNIIDNYVSTTTAQFDVVNTSTLNANVIDSLTITTNNLQANVIGGLQAVNLSISTGNSYTAVFPTKNLSTYISSFSITQSGLYNFETNAAPSPPGGIVYINSPYDIFIFQATPYGTTNPIQQGVFIQPQYAGTAYSGTFTFYALGSAGFLVQFLQAGDGLILAATPYVVLPGWYVSITYSYPPGFYQSCTYSVTVLYQPIPGSATSTITKSQVGLVTDVYETLLNTSNIYQTSGVLTSVLGNFALNVSTATFGSNTTRNNLYPFQFTGAVQAPTVSTTAVYLSSINGRLFSDIIDKSNPYLSAITISTSQITTSSLQMIGGTVMSTNLSYLSSGQFDVSKVYNLTSTTFGAISSFQNNIMSYIYNATIGDETAFNIGLGYNLGANNVSQWASTILQGNNANAPMTIEIDNDPATAFLGTGTFDVQRLAIPGNTPYDISVQYSLGGSVIVDIGFSDYRLYRFTKSTTGVGGWTYTISPAPYTTSNNNTFQITQNLTDVSITTTDNLNLNAGSIKLNGALQLSNVNVTKAKIQNASISTLTASNIQFQNLSSINHQTNNESVTNLYAGYINTSSINITTQEITPFILGNYSNTYNVITYYTPPPNQIITSENDMTVTSSNPSYTYAGSGTDVITFDIGGVTKLNGTIQTNTNWFYSLFRINNSVRLNISTVAGGTCNANFPANTNITNFSIKGGNTLGFYTSASGFIGNVTGGSITLHWTSLNDFNTTVYVPWTGLTYQSKQQITQTVSSVSYNATCPQYFSSPTLNIYTNPSSNNPTVKFGGRTIEVFSQRVNGFITNAGDYGKGDVGATATSPGGKTFPISQYNCVVSQVAANVYGEAALALNEQVWKTLDDGAGNWAFHFYCTTATIPGAVPPNFYAIAGITMIPYDLGGFSGYQNPDHLGEGNGGPPVYPRIQLSTIYASTITTQAFENVSILAGPVSIPTYFSTGSITVLGTNNVSVLGNVLALGGQTDVDIQANTNNVNIVAGSNINLSPSNYLYINAGSYMNTDVYGDMTTDLGGVYTVTSAEVINLNGSNGIGLTSSNDMNLTATSTLNLTAPAIINNGLTTLITSGTSAITSVSPLAITDGNDYAGTSRSQIEFQFYGGGFNHYISSRHNANVTYDSGNAIDFWLYSVTTGGDAQTASSAPGTGNVNTMSLTASNVVINRPIQISDTLTGGVGTLTVDSGNHLYWNGTLIA